MTASENPTPEVEPTPDVEQVEPKLTRAQKAEQDAKAVANVPEAFHEQARAEGWAEGQQGPFAR